ncbi:MAG: hypothetical protein ACE5R4_00075 [Armatimonadota bacterium]
MHTHPIPLTRSALQAVLTDKVVEVMREPDYSWGDGFRSFMSDDEGKPVVRLALANCTPDTDIWEGLRSPAQAGMYPIGLCDVWMHYAASNVQSTRYDGSPNPLAVPEPFEEAQERLKRAVIISAMLPLNPEVYAAYAEKVERGDLDPWDYYCHARIEVGALIDKAVAKLALALMAPRRAVVPMTARGAATVADRTRSEYLRGSYHGPCNNHYPQNSIAAMTGLLRFGVNRLPFRDEVWPDGSVRRLCGQYASIIVFDEDDVVQDGSGGVSVLDADRRAWLRRVNDFTDVAPEAVAQRFCTYNVLGSDGNSVCTKCIESCPSGALANSSPDPSGIMDELLTRQTHRFSEGALKFDYGTCNRDRGQKAQLYDEYVCARCEAVCAAKGVRRPASEVEAMSD